VRAELLYFGSWLCGSMPIRRLKETNKEEEELLDVAPH
jgi:hypothetical protein